MGSRDVPDEDSVRFFISKLDGHNRVTGYERRSTQVFEVTSDRELRIIVFLSDLYTVGIADYFDIRGKEKGINCIVTASGYNSYTADAKEQDQVGLFKIGEFMGALHHEDYWNYDPPKKDGKDRIA